MSFPRAGRGWWARGRYFTQRVAQGYVRITEMRAAIIVARAVFSDVRTSTAVEPALMRAAPLDFSVEVAQSVVPAALRSAAAVIADPRTTLDTAATRFTGVEALRRIGYPGVEGANLHFFPT